MDGVFVRENHKTPLKWMIWGYPYFRKPPYIQMANDPAAFVLEMLKHSCVHRTITQCSTNGRSKPMVGAGNAIQTQARNTR